MMEKLKAARAELRIRRRVFNAAARDLDKLVTLIARLEAQREKLARVK